MIDEARARDGNGTPLRAWESGHPVATPLAARQTSLPTASPRRCSRCRDICCHLVPPRVTPSRGSRRAGRKHMRLLRVDVSGKRSKPVMVTTPGGQQDCEARTSFRDIPIAGCVGDQLVSLIIQGSRRRGALRAAARTMRLYAPLRGLPLATCCCSRPARASASNPAAHAGVSGRRGDRGVARLARRHDRHRHGACGADEGSVLRAIPALKEQLQVDVELATPADFMPVRARWKDRGLSRAE